MLLGWRTRTDVEQANVANISELVGDCESLFSAERQAWVSTAMANSKAMLSAGDDEGGAAGGPAERGRNDAKVHPLSA